MARTATDRLVASNFALRFFFSCLLFPIGDILVLSVTPESRKVQKKTELFH